VTHCLAASSVMRDVAQALLAWLTEEQRPATTALIDAPELALSAQHAVVEESLSEVTCAGGLRPDGAHYDAIKGPIFPVEYDDVQNEANHVDDFWRGLRHDWGWDLLAAHHAGRL
jgi:hypothetical protein